MALTQNVDASYPDDASDASVKLHQTDHDEIHRQLWRPTRQQPFRQVGQTMIWGGQSGHPYTTTGGTGSTFNLNDTSTFAIGSQSISITTNGTGQNTYVRKLSGTAMNFTNRVPVVWIKIDNLATLLDFKFWLGSGGALSAVWTWSLMDSATYRYAADGEWFAMTLPWSRATVTGSPTRSALTDVNLQVYDKSAGGTTVHWGGFASIPDTTSVYPNGVVTFTFDDGLDVHYTKAKPYLDKYGYAATFLPIIDVVGTAGYMTVAQMQSLVTSSGWEAGVHAYTAATHNGTGGITALNASDQVKDIVQAREWLVSNGFQSPDVYAYPQGLYDQATIANLRPWVTSARTTGFGPTDTLPNADRMKQRSYALSSSNVSGDLTAIIDQVKANKEWVIFTIHGIDTPTASTTTTSAVFQALVDYCNTTGVAVRTMGEVLRANLGA